MRMRNDIKKRVLDEYVNSEAFVTRADDLGYRVSDKDCWKSMAQVPAFQVDGKFDYNHALALLRCAGALACRDRGTVSPRCEAAPTRYRADGLELCHPDRIERHPQHYAPAARTRLVHLVGDQVRRQRHAGRCAVKAYFDAHKADYMTPETVNVRYVEISLAA